MKKLIKFILIVIIIIGVIKYTPMVLEYYFPKNYNAHVEVCAEKYGVDRNLIFAVIKAESGFDRVALSSKGAKGLMQIMDNTAQWCAAETGYSEFDILDPGTNIELGTFYLSYLLEKYERNEKSALAAYNAGHGNVDKWLSESGSKNNLSEIPFPETEKYVKKVQLYKKVYAWRD